MVFSGERDKAEHFLTQWRLFAGINLNNEAIRDYYQRSMLFLTYIQGKAVSEWVRIDERLAHHASSRYGSINLGQVAMGQLPPLIQLTIR